MTIQIEYETERKLEIPYEKLAEKVASHILELEECPYEISVNLVITDNEEIRLEHYHCAQQLQTEPTGKPEGPCPLLQGVRSTLWLQIPLHRG